MNEVINFEDPDFFDLKLPQELLDKFLALKSFCHSRGIDFFETIFELLGVCRIEGYESRYQQTPIEFFPFGGTGCDGIHYGMICHTIENDYSFGEICPMDSDGVLRISDSSKNLFNNLIDFERLNFEDSLLIELIKLLGLDKEKQDRYDKYGNTLAFMFENRMNWMFINTSDGVGIYAEKKYFAPTHLENKMEVRRKFSTELYESMAVKMLEKGFYASSLFYLKELYWFNWTNYDDAKRYLAEMKKSYEGLNREHLYNMTNKVLSDFDRIF